MVPSDGRFVPYEKTKPNTLDSKPATNGRIFVLSFQSSSQKHLFWLQSRSQHANGDPSWFSPRDLKLGEIVDRLLQADEVNVQEELANVSNNQPGQGGGDGDVNMEDVQPEAHETSQGSSSGRGPSAGGPTHEGQGAAGGGTDAGTA